MITIKNVSKRFINQTVLTNVNLEIAQGETVGFVGGNGSGKSVLFSMIAGIISVTHGQIMVRGKEIGVDIDFPENVGVMINEPSYVDFYSGFKNLYYLSLIRNVIDKDKIREVMRNLNLDPDDKKPVRAYSSGMKQKLSLAQAMMEDQSLLILDEPFNALDHETYREILNQIHSLKKEGKTILLTSHNHRDIEQVCDRVYFIDKGQVMPFTEEIKEDYFSVNLS